MTGADDRTLADLVGIRREYRTTGMAIDDLSADPFDAFATWFDEAREIFGDDANVVVLATSDPRTGRPSARNVLLKGLTGGRLAFFTNEESRKGRELLANAQATLLFSWVPIGRQVVVEGPVARLSAEESDVYFATRPRGSQIGVWASDQSRPVASRAELEARAAEVARRFGDGEISRPPHWGGFAMTPDRFDFWQGRENRLHDRIEFTAVDERWMKRRLAP